MEIMSNIYDYRIKSTNLYIETTFGEYLQYAKDLIKNNDLQRKRVKTSQTVYSLLKEDLLNGCVIPPLVLAVMSDDDRLKSMESDELQDYINLYYHWTNHLYQMILKCVFYIIMLEFQKIAFLNYMLMGFELDGYFLYSLWNHRNMIMCRMSLNKNMHI